MKGMPWQITITEEQIQALKDYVQKVRRIKRSKKEVV